MQALILNGARQGEDITAASHDVMNTLLSDKGYMVKSYALNKLDIKNCIGCFGCWVKTPGVCAIDDIGRDIAKDVIQSDLVVYLTPIVFGGLSSELKKVVDRFIPLLLPFFEKKSGEIHHPARYDKYPSVIVLGVLSEENQEMEAIFRNLVKRNILNWHNDQYMCEILYSTLSKEDIKTKTDPLLKCLEVATC